MARTSSIRVGASKCDGGGANAGRSSGPQLLMHPEIDHTAAVRPTAQAPSAAAAASRDDLTPSSPPPEDWRGEGRSWIKIAGAGGAGLSKRRSGRRRARVLTRPATHSLARRRHVSTAADQSRRRRRRGSCRRPSESRVRRRRRLDVSHSRRRADGRRRNSRPDGRLLRRSCGRSDGLPFDAARRHGIGTASGRLVPRRGGGTGRDIRRPKPRARSLSRCRRSNFGGNAPVVCCGLRRSASRRCSSRRRRARRRRRPRGTPRVLLGRTAAAIAAPRRRQGQATHPEQHGLGNHVEGVQAVGQVRHHIAAAAEARRRQRRRPPSARSATLFRQLAERRDFPARGAERRRWRRRRRRSLNTAVCLHQFAIRLRSHPKQRLATRWPFAMPSIEFRRQRACCLLRTALCSSGAAAWRAGRWEALTPRVDSL